MIEEKQDGAFCLTCASSCIISSHAESERAKLEERRKPTGSHQWRMESPGGKLVTKHEI